MQELEKENRELKQKLAFSEMTFSKIKEYIQRNAVNSNYLLMLINKALLKIKK